MKSVFVIMAVLALASGPVLAGDSKAVSGSESNASIEGLTGSVGDYNAGLDAAYERGRAEAGATARADAGPSRSIAQESVEYSGSYTVKSAPPVNAPGLTTTLTETCMGSTSSGVSTIGFGMSFGTTWRDSACVRRLDARQISSLGYNLAAKELMCDSEQVAAAFKRAGKPCYNDLPEDMKRPEDRAAVAPTPVEQEEVTEEEAAASQM